MIDKRFLIIPVLTFAAVLCFAQEEPADSELPYEDSEFLYATEDWEDEEGEYGEEFAGTDAEPEEQAEEVAVPKSILDNPYFIKSVQLNEQAKEAFEEGEYDASVAYAEEAKEYARLSDEYVFMRMADSALARADSRYTWAVSVGAARRYPTEYRIASAAYNEAVKARKAENWDGTIAASARVLAALAKIKGTGGEEGPIAEPIHTIVIAPKGNNLPAQYTVRNWRETGDCFSAIAGWPWVYGDPHQWQKLYEANRNKLPNPNNPNLILPGMVIDIPSLKGEVRSGMWDPSKH